MNKFVLLLMSILCAAAVLVSCSEASKLSGATTEPNGMASGESETVNTLSSTSDKLSSGMVEVPSSSATTGSSNSAVTVSSSSAKAVSSSSANRPTSSSMNASISSSSEWGMIIDTLTPPMSEEAKRLCDSVLAAFENTTGQGVSRTGFDFESGGELFYTTQSCSVNIYEQESGVRILYGDGGRLENTSLYYQEKGVLLRLLNNTYGGGTCEQDLVEFKKNCRKESGVFKDYNDGEGCSLGKLELACVSVVDASSTRAMLQREANLYKKVCQGITVPGDQECSATCEFVGNEMACDTVCHSL
ncbi:MAG: hypothetical protein IKZ45_00165 [Fibrobacter sp.]|nr:hypothetical protein [Fibrobacter sp.]